MTLAETLLRKLENPSLNYDEQAGLRCRIAADFEHRGHYEAAQDALAELWQGIGKRPLLEGLTELTAAEVLLRIGTLSSSLASIQQVEDKTQEVAKDLISESISRLETLGELTRAAIARSDLALCYWRQGANDEARIQLTTALQELMKLGIDGEQKAKVLVRLTLVEVSSGRYHDALHILTDNAPILEASKNEALKGRFHGQFAIVLMRLGKVEHRQDFIDRAIIEYTAAIYHFEQAGHTSYRASSENDLGFLLYTIGRYAEAHQHLDRARRLFIDVNDNGRIAQVDDARARVLLAEGRTKEAERTIRDAVRVLGKGGEQGLLAEALTTQGIVLARAGSVQQSQDKLRQAADIAERAGSLDDAGRALLSLIEKHAGWLSARELYDAYQRADALLKDTQDAETIARLRFCARHVMSAQLTSTPLLSEDEQRELWANLPFAKAVHAFEARLIQTALREAQGSITRAAHLLGFNHHGSLAALLQGRHKNLMPLRTVPETRRQSIIPDAFRASRSTAKSSFSAIILHVEDNQLVADAVKDTLESLKWKVETCDNGIDALRKIESNTRYDLLVVDNELPGATGFEIVRHARQLQHRRRIPIIMLSASNVEPEAWRAGVNAFLRKPEDAQALTDTIARLLGIKIKQRWQ